MNNIGKKLEVFIIIVIIAVIGVIYAFKQRLALAPTNDSTSFNQTSDDSSQAPNNATSINPEAGGQTQTQPQVASNVIEYKGQDGKNALELLKASHRVDAQHYSFGDLVSGIDGITPDTKHFWAMYVNGQFSQVGASAYETKSSDTIKWQMDAVVDTTK
jgi:hypothetical protein